MTPADDDPDPAAILTPDDLADALLRTLLKSADARQDASNDELIAEVLAWKRRHGS